jgi:hypothetical protein
LTAYDGHDFSRFTLDAVVNTVNAAHAAPVSFPNIINGWIQKRLFGNLFEPVKKVTVHVINTTCQREYQSPKMPSRMIFSLKKISQELSRL